LTVAQRAENRASSFRASMLQWIHMWRERKQIMIADDDAGMRRVIAGLISQRPDWELCAEAEDGEQVVKFAKLFCPDVAILDIQMPVLNGIEAARQILQHCPSAIIVTESTHDVAVYLEHLKAIGVKGFVSKERLRDDLLSTVDAVLRGKTCFPALVSVAH